MNKAPLSSKLFSIIGLAFFGQASLATQAPLPEQVPLGQTFTIEEGSSIDITGSLEIFGTLDNYGALTNGNPTAQGHMDITNTGLLNNYGDFYQNSNLSIFGPKSLVNHPDGTMIFRSYLEINTHSEAFENFGRVLFLEGGNLYFKSNVIRNHGYFYFGGSPEACAINLGVVQANPKPGFVNDGTFEIRSGRECSHPQLTYLQTAGETKVNGILSGTITVEGGRLSGNGAIVGITDAQTLSPKVTIAPGAPIGTLTLAPAGDDLICTGCVTEIEIGGEGNRDMLHINGSAYLSGWKLNVALVNGYVPPAGTTFNVVTGNYVMFYGGAPKYTLPQLPNGRAWSVENTGTSIVLHAN